MELPRILLHDVTGAAPPDSLSNEASLFLETTPISLHMFDSFSMTINDRNTARSMHTKVEEGLASRRVVALMLDRCLKPQVLVPRLKTMYDVEHHSGSIPIMIVSYAEASFSL